MRKRILLALLVIGIFAILTVQLSAQMVFNVGQSSEWEATAFNNGRKVVRDCSMFNIGYFHYVWHSQSNPANAPSGTGCDIYYACTDHNGMIMIPPTNLTAGLHFEDNRYPSIAIENDGLDGFGNWRTFNDIHLVWQVKETAGNPYEVYHGVIPVGNPPLPPAGLGLVKNLSQTPNTDSLVPAVAINHYGASPVTDQNIHVVWQEEDVNGIFNPASDIYYTFSPDCGNNFMGPAGGGMWDNITNTRRNSQMPTISCCLDTFFGFPLDYTGGDCDYATNDVHVAYNEDTFPGGINIFYRHSTTNGFTWLARQNITLLTGGALNTKDGYPSIAADMLDFAHITFMRDVAQNEPGAGYSPGINPVNIVSFPGPDPGMYNNLNNPVVYWSSNPNMVALPPMVLTQDREFPTVGLDRDNNVTINWQEFAPFIVGGGDYETTRIFIQNVNMPMRPLLVPLYGPWSGLVSDSMDLANDDLFPNLAHKKVSMYWLNNFPLPGYTEIWTKVMGNGSGAATAANPKDIMVDNNMSRDPAVN